MTSNTKSPELDQESSSEVLGKDFSDFDREYGLSDLLDAAVLENLCAKAQKVGDIPILLFFPDGTLYYATELVLSEDIDSMSTIIQKEQLDSPKSFRLARLTISLFPLIHELEVIGYCALGYEKKEDDASYSIESLGYPLSYALNQLIIARYKILLTSGLHGQVIEDSYALLKERAAQLEKSEQKYRLLAESLEIQVEKKAQEIKQTHIRLIQQEKMASIGYLAAGVAHEINNPIGFITSNLTTFEDYKNTISQMIQKYRKIISNLKEWIVTKENNKDIITQIEHIQDCEQKSKLDFILDDITDLLMESQQGALRIKKIVENLKDFAGPENDEAGYADINASLDSTLTIIRNKITSKTILKKEYGELPLVQCYPRQINHVFMNVLLNAAQAISEQGEITIVTKADAGYVEITISDTGEGIAEENLSKIFDPFFSTKDVNMGTGLGLNITYKIIEKHKGSITVDSIVGRGTTFIIKIPFSME